MTINDQILRLHRSSIRTGARQSSFRAGFSRGRGSSLFLRFGLGRFTPGRNGFFHFHFLALEIRRATAALDDFAMLLAHGPSL
ncbi:MAG: hypothetical protein ACXWF1_02210 [Chthoniobacterales bacterium]